jgi:hypothetical protein
MQYAATRSTLPSRHTILVPLVALLVGAAAAVGGYALIDNQDTVQAPSKVVFVDTPAPGAQASDSTPRVAPYLSHGGSPTSDGSSTKDEAAAAAAIGSGSALSADSANRTDPHGPAPQLHRH